MGVISLTIGIPNETGYLAAQYKRHTQVCLYTQVLYLISYTCKYTSNQYTQLVYLYWIYLPINRDKVSTQNIQDSEII